MKVSKKMKRLCQMLGHDFWVPENNLAEMGPGVVCRRCGATQQ